jgi:hypothetical protein
VAFTPLWRDSRWYGATVEEALGHLKLDAAESLRDYLTLGITLPDHRIELLEWVNITPRHPEPSAGRIAHRGSELWCRWYAGHRSTSRACAQYGKVRSSAQLGYCSVVEFSLGTDVRDPLSWKSVGSLEFSSCPTPMTAGAAPYAVAGYMRGRHPRRIDLCRYSFFFFYPNAHLFTTRTSIHGLYPVHSGRASRLSFHTPLA